MTKKIVRDVVVNYFDIELLVKDILEDCEHIIKVHGPTARFEYKNDYYDDTKTLVVTVEREETDEEYEKRLENQAYWKKVNDERDAKEFERLKKKFGEQQ